MATINSLAIVGSVREQLQGGLAAVPGYPRALSALTIADGTYPSLGDGEKQRRALVLPRYDVRITEIAPAPGARFSEQGDTQIVRIKVVVTATYAITPEMRAEVVSKTQFVSALDELRAQAIDDAERVRQALSYPGALTYRIAQGQPTGLVSGLLRQADSGAIVTRETAEANAGLLEVEQQFYGLVQVRPATS